MSAVINPVRRAVLHRPNYRVDQIDRSAQQFSAYSQPRLTF